MRRRFLIANVNQIPMRAAPAWEIDRLPRPGKWVKDWEWKYTFSEAFHELERDLKRKATHLCLKMLAALGCAVNPGFQQYTDSVEYVDIDEERIAEALFRKIYEPARGLLIRGESLIVVGPAELQELYKVAYGVTAVQFMLRVNYFTQKNRADQYYGRYATDIEFCDVPVFCVPDFVGVAVLPKSLFQADGGYVYR